MISRTSFCAAERLKYGTAAPSVEHLQKARAVECSVPCTSSPGARIVKPRGRALKEGALHKPIKS